MAERTVTFLFTDIEGSTRLWNRYPSAMTAAVPQQETLLRDIVTAYHGAVFKTVGDGVYAVFADPPNALRASVAAQTALISHHWDGFDTGDALRVRFALHTGAAEQLDGDYFGPTLNRLSRTLAAGHGGQILCTEETVTACGEQWPDSIATRDLGERTLRDVPGSGRIYQLVADGLPQHFPPLITLDPRTHNLPRWASPMVGRASEAERLRTALRHPGIRLITVLGTGGVGKTRLTTEVASQLLDEFQDGIRFVDLSALRADAEVRPAVVQTLGATDPLLSPHDALREWLRTREVLLVIDNCEQVIPGVADLCGDILHTAPNVTIVATSRVPLRIRSERQFALDPLDVSEAPPVNPAVTLFAERAHEISESFTLDSDSAAEIAAICRIVDGLPLAIELAAAWVRILSPAALHRRLSESRAMLRDGARDLPDRQRTLSNTIAWSYDLLEPEDQRAFRRLAVFRGGIAVDAAAAVIWHDPVTDPLWALGRLDALVQANLLQVAPDPTGEPRFLMLQTIQEFAIGTLRASGEWDDAASAHAEFFSDLLRQSRNVAGTPDAVALFDRLDLDIVNLDDAMAYLLSTADGSVTLDIVLCGWHFLDLRNHFERTHAWIDRALATASDLPESTRVTALKVLGDTSLNESLTQAADYYRQAVELARSSGDTTRLATASLSLAQVVDLLGEREEALKSARESVSIVRTLDQPSTLIDALIMLADIESRGEDLGLARMVVEEIATLEPGSGDLAWALLLEARISQQQGQPERAVARFREAQRRFDELGDNVGSVYCDFGLLELHETIGIEPATASLRRATATMLYDQAFSMLSVIFAGMSLASSQGEDELVAQWLGACEALRQRLGIVHFPYRQRMSDTITRSTEARLGITRFHELFEQGLSDSPRVAQASFARWVNQESHRNPAMPAPITPCQCT